MKSGQNHLEDANIPGMDNGDTIKRQALLLELLSRVAQGDEEAFTGLYRQMSRSVYAFAMRRLADPVVSEDVVVETLCEVWRKAGSFQGRSLVTTWILGIARHKVLDILAQRGGKALVELDEAAEIADEGPGGFEIVAQKQRAEHVIRCLETLPDIQRECMHLVFYEELSLAEIATIQGCPENTVKTRLFHARRKMRDCVERQLGETEGDDER